MSASLPDLSLAELSAAIERQEVTSRTATEAALTRIAEVQPKINCFIGLEADAALAAADRADEEIANGRWRGPLHGVPLAHKDAFDRKGKITTAGSTVLDRTAEFSATVIRAFGNCRGALSRHTESR